MLDQEHGDPLAGQVRQHRRPSSAVSSWFETGARLVEQEDRRAWWPGPGPARPGGPGRWAASRSARRPRRGSPTWSRRRSACWRGVTPVGQLAPLGLRRHLDVLPGRQGAEELQALEGAGQSQLRARRCGRSLVMSLPSRRTRPRVGGWRPVITLNSVVLPAPLGPMSPFTGPAAPRGRRPAGPGGRRSGPRSPRHEQLSQRKPPLLVDGLARGHRRRRAGPTTRACRPPGPPPVADLPRTARRCRWGCGRWRRCRRR